VRFVKKIMNEHGRPTIIAVTKSIYPEVKSKIKSILQNMNLPVYQSIYDAAKPSQNYTNTS